MASPNSSPDAPTKRIAIIGAGISGLTLAAELKAFSPHAEIVIFEKSRGVAGRMATRRADPFSFDHGTQFITARTTEFKAWLEPLIRKGLLAEWTGKVVSLHSPDHLEERPWPEPHYVPTPHMTSLCKHIAAEANVLANIALNTEVGPLFMRHPEGNQEGNHLHWHLFDAGCNLLGAFDWVLSTAPPLQTRNLFAAHVPSNSTLSQSNMLGCFTLMLGLNKPWDRDWILAKIRTASDSPISLIAIDSTKPMRNGKVTSIVVHSRNDWAQAHIDDDPSEVQATLLQELAALTGIQANKAAFLQMHRWRYAMAAPHQPEISQPETSQPASPHPAGAFFDPELQLASTGDWCTSSRVEEAWLNARSLAATLRHHL